MAYLLAYALACLVVHVPIDVVRKTIIVFTIQLPAPIQISTVTHTLCIAFGLTFERRSISLVTHRCSRRCLIFRASYLSLCIVATPEPPPAWQALRSRGGRATPALGLGLPCPDVAFPAPASLYVSPCESACHCAYLGTYAGRIGSVRIRVTLNLCGSL